MTPDTKRHLLFLNQLAYDKGHKSQSDYEDYKKLIESL